MNSNEVRYFAMLKELADREFETVHIEHEKTYADLYRTLAQKHRFPLDVKLIQVAVNDEFSDMGETIRPGVSIVFIPPVAGG